MLFCLVPQGCTEEMRFHLLSQGQSLCLAGGGGDGLSHRSEFIPSLLPESTAPEMSREPLNPGKSGSRRGPGKQHASVLPGLFCCQALLVKMLSRWSHISWLGGVVAAAEARREPGADGSPWFCSPGHTHPGVLLH